MENEDIRQFSVDELKARRTERKTGTRPDAPAFPVDPDFWQNARVVMPDQGKSPVNIRIDRDVLDWFRARGKATSPG